MSRVYKCFKCGKVIGIWTSLEYNKERYCRKCWTEVVGWYRCSRCGKKIGITKQKFNEKYYCLDCYLEVTEKGEQDNIFEMPSVEKMIKPL